MANLSTADCQDDLKHYSDHFLSCIKWTLAANEFVCTPTSQQLVYEAHNITYESREFMIVKNGTLAYVCVPEELQARMGFLDNVCNVYIRGTTVFFLWLSIAVHMVVVRETRGANVRPIIFHKLSLSVFYLCMIIRFGSFAGSGVFVPSLVMTVGFYAARAAYCWLNVISFETWRTFHPQNVRANLGVAPTRPRRFIAQCLYAWGLPIVIMGTAFLLGALPLPREQKWRVWGPTFGNIAQVCFMIISLSSISLVNAVLGSMVIINILRIRKDVHQFIANDDHKEMFFVYIKLVVLSDVLFFLYYAQMITLHYTIYSPYWLIFDWVANAQGIWLFLIYCCNPSVCKGTKKKVAGIYSTASGSLRRTLSIEVEH